MNDPKGEGKVDLKTILACILILPALLAVHEKGAAGTAPRDTSFTVYGAYIKESRKYPFIRIVKPLLPEGVKADTNVVYASYGERALCMDVFYPADERGGTFPAVILVHGGAWRSGDRSQQIPMAERLAAEGYVSAAVEYRLSGEARFPAAVFDLKAAVRFIRANALKYRVDPGRIAVLGCSAGGQLAALVGITNGRMEFEGGGGHPDESSGVQAIVDVDGVLDMTAPDSKKYDDDPQKPSAAALWLGGSYKTMPDRWKEASPLFYVDPKSPPILFVNSSQPRFHAGRDEMIERLRTFGIKYEMCTMPDTPHPFWLFHPWFEKTLERIVHFLDSVFDKK
jgi:pectinesterase